MKTYTPSCLKMVLSNQPSRRCPEGRKPPHPKSPFCPGEAHALSALGYRGQTPLPRANLQSRPSPGASPGVDSGLPWTAWQPTSPSARTCLRDLPSSGVMPRALPSERPARCSTSGSQTCPSVCTSPVHTAPPGRVSERDVVKAQLADIARSPGWGGDRGSLRTAHRGRQGREGGGRPNRHLIPKPSDKSESCPTEAS